MKRIIGKTAGGANTPNESNSKAHIKSVAGSKISRLIDHITGDKASNEWR